METGGRAIGVLLPAVQRKRPSDTSSLPCRGRGGEERWPGIRCLFSMFSPFTGGAASTSFGAFVGGSALPLLLVSSWRCSDDTDTSWVSTKFPNGPLRSADGRTKEVPCHASTQPQCAYNCLQYLLVDLNYTFYPMGGTQSADAIREARLPSRGRR